MIVAIENSVVRDRHLFLGNGHSAEEYVQDDYKVSFPTSSLLKRQKINLANVTLHYKMLYVRDNLLIYLEGLV